MDMEKDLKVQVEQLKHGDFIYCSKNKEEWYAVVDEVWSSRIQVQMEVEPENCCLEPGISYFNIDCYQRLASDDEIEKIFEFLKIEYNYNCWFDENNDLHLDDWKPEYMENYFSLVFNNKTFSFEPKMFLCGEDENIDEMFRKKDMMFYSMVYANIKKEIYNRTIENLYKRYILD